MDPEDTVVHTDGKRLYPWKPDQPEVGAAIEAWDELTYIGGKKCYEEQTKVHTASKTLF